MSTTMLCALYTLAGFSYILIAGIFWGLDFYGYKESRSEDAKLGAVFLALLWPIGYLVPGPWFAGQALVSKLQELKNRLTIPEAKIHKE